MGYTTSKPGQTLTKRYLNWTKGVELHEQSTLSDLARIDMAARIHANKCVNLCVKRVVVLTCSVHDVQQFLQTLRVILLLLLCISCVCMCYCGCCQSTFIL